MEVKTKKCDLGIAFDGDADRAFFIDDHAVPLPGSTTTAIIADWFLAQQRQCRGYTRAIFSGLPTVVLAQLVRDVIIPDSSLHGLYHIAADPISKRSMKKENGTDGRMRKSPPLAVLEELGAAIGQQGPVVLPHLVEEVAGLHHGLGHALVLGPAGQQGLDALQGRLGAAHLLQGQGRPVEQVGVGIGVLALGVAGGIALTVVANDKAAEAEAQRWIEGAKRVVEPTREDVVKAARAALALERLIAEHRADALCVGTCMGWLRRGFPCLAGMLPLAGLLLLRRFW